MQKCQGNFPDCILTLNQVELSRSNELLNNSIDKFKKSLEKTAEFRHKVGEQFLINGKGMGTDFDRYNRFKNTSNSFRNLNTNNSDGKVIIENEFLYNHSKNLALNLQIEA